MAKYSIVIQTRNGNTITGEESEMTEEEVVQAQKLIGDLMVGSKGQINVEVEGDTIWVPLHSIDHLGLMKY